MRWALRALLMVLLAGCHRSEETATVQSLIAALKSDRAETRYMASKALGERAEGAKEAVPALAAGIFDLAVGAEVGLGAILVAWLLVHEHASVPVDLKTGKADILSSK